ncbi:MAG: hypothetical protein HWE21_03990 [Cytophagia bacterium]|nr:hypothetical protein [Cytophagia bacterium]
MSLPVTFAFIFLFSSAASAQMLVITDVRELDGTVEIEIETTIEGPIEIITGVDLVGQAPDDIYVGAGERITIAGYSAVASIPLVRSDGSVLPAGDYEAVAAFYPRWGAEAAPAATRAITDTIEANPVPVTLQGSGQTVDDTVARDEMQRWVMLNVVIHMAFDGAVLAERLGSPERMAVTNRTDIIVAWYYPEADLTIFQNTLKGEVVTWREGRQDAL